MRLLLLVAVIIAIFFAVAFVVSVIYGRIQKLRALRSENPMIANMTRKERRAYARELRERDQEQYDLQLQQDQLDILYGKKFS